MKQRDARLDVFRSVGCIIIVIYHVSTITMVSNICTMFQNELFFFASGFLYRSESILSRVKNRAYRILLPYLVFGVLTLIYYVALESRFRDVGISITDGVLGIITGNKSLLDFNSPLWFLPCLFLVDVVYNIVDNICSRECFKKAGIFIVSICSLGVMCYENMRGGGQ